LSLLSSAWTALLSSTRTAWTQLEEVLEGWLAREELEEEHPEAVDVGRWCVQEQRGGEVREELRGKEARERRLLLVESSGIDKVAKTCGTRESSGRAKVMKMCHARFGLHAHASRFNFFGHPACFGFRFGPKMIFLCWLLNTVDTKNKFFLASTVLSNQHKNSIFGVG
jgi:hypothetical protein